MKKKIFIILLTALFLFVSVVQAQASELLNPRILPDSPFYFLKSWIESIGTFFTFGTESRVKRFLKLSEIRLAEAVILNERGKTELADKTLQEYQNNFESAMGDLEKKAHSENFIASLLDPLVGYAVRGFNRLESVPIQNEKAIQKHQDNLERLIALDIKIKERVDAKLPDRRGKRPEVISEEPEMEPESETETGPGPEHKTDPEPEPEPKPEPKPGPKPEPKPDPVDDKKDTSWPDENGYIYNKGKHAEIWTAGRNSGHSGNEISKQADYLWLKADAKDGAAITWVTSEKIDMSKWDSLLFIYKWEHSNRLQSPDGPEYSRFDPWIDISNYNEKAYIEFTVLNPSTRAHDPTTSALQVRIGTHNEIIYDGDRSKLFGTDTLAGLEIYSVWLEK